MSKYGPKPPVPQVNTGPQVATAPLQVQEKNIEWSIRDTEFLLRLLMSSKIDGGDVEVAASVISKIKDLHSKIVGHKVII